MTATRWWVRMAARWIARIDSVQGQLGLLFQAMTGISLASGALKYFGLSHLVPWFILGTWLFVLAYAYLYSEGGVWNQVSRDKTDLSDNYSGPTMLMDKRIEGKQLAYLGYVLQNGRDISIDELEEGMSDITHQEWATLRDGVDVEGLGELEERRQ